MTTEHSWPTMTPQHTEEFLNSYFRSMPPGYRFNPTDEELIVYYLRNKVLKLSLPLNRIKEVNIYDYNPQQLYDNYKIEGENYMYFFSSRDRKYPKGNRPRRSAADGYWKATGVDLKIKQTDITIGRRKGLVYYQGTHKDSVKTNWIMYEYRLASNTDTSCNKKSQNASTSNTTAPIDMRLDDCVLYRIHKKSEKAKEENENDVGGGNVDSTSSNPSMQAHYYQGNVPEIFPPTIHAPLRQFSVEDRVISNVFEHYFPNPAQGLPCYFGEETNSVPNTTSSAGSTAVPSTNGCIAPLPHHLDPRTYYYDYPLTNFGELAASNPPALD